MPITVNNPQNANNTSSATLTVSSYDPGSSGGPVIVAAGVRENPINSVDMLCTFGGVSMTRVGQDIFPTGAVTGAGCALFYLDKEDWPSTPADVVLDGNGVGGMFNLFMTVATLDGAADGGPEANNTGADSAELDISVTTLTDDAVVIGAFHTQNSSDPINMVVSQSGQVAEDVYEPATNFAAGLMISSKPEATAGSSTSGFNSDTTVVRAAGVIGAWALDASSNLVIIRRRRMS